ncbi:hypothetical protein TSOC_003116 [Tetrabaena socialis]|uniref:Uncharacterized protein n=1 Tax=Tetrabaena socialis TaxID=47790 RepID=A0A2J8ACB6_9CHLO|nr:hypothetical protein TSOC_003116 [Tetrabaena socialis]|eukprot:PNH10158.1 hypothetical protein TSOC_003116 [Tetrabaena socialis]
MSEAGVSEGARAAIPSPAQLWASTDAAVWGSVRESYTSAVTAVAARKGKGKAALPELDRWFATELPAKLRGDGPEITREDLMKLVDWKLARGTWRPQLQAYARGQAVGAVEAASRKALALLRDYAAPSSHEGTSAVPTAAPASTSRPASGVCGSAGAPGSDEHADSILQEALAALTELKGVGPATASALLSAASPRLAPYMGDEAMAAVLPPGRKVEYTVRAYKELASALRRKAEQLSSGGARWAAAGVEQCLWVAAVLHTEGGGSHAAAGKRGTAEADDGRKAGKRSRK